MTATATRRRPDSVERDEVLEFAVVGAGFAGLGLGIQARRSGRESFVILERADEVGGTWRDNIYPGVACDVPSHLYSYSFRPKPDWSQRFAPGAEIQQYLRDCATAEGLTAHLRLGTALERADWEPGAGRWHLQTSRGVLLARSLVMAAGRLSEPRFPDVDREAFAATVFHSSQWPADLDVRGQRVGVVGTGASAVQLIPEIADDVAQLVIFQRSAPYVLPRQNHQYSTAEQTTFTLEPPARQRHRDSLFVEAEVGVKARLGAEAELLDLRRRAAAHRDDQLRVPALRSALTPDYEIGCKRITFSDDFYPTLEREHVRLVSSPLAQLEPGRAVALDGSSHALDVLVLATGFHATSPPFAQHITGRSGRTLAQQWGEGMVSHASTTVHGFPNFFVLDGPNASLGHNSAVFMIETQVDYTLGALAHLRHHPGAALEVTASAQADYTAEIEVRSRDSVWLTGGCSSWYRDERSGRLTLLWPGSAASFRERNGTFDADSYTLTPAR